MVFGELCRNSFSRSPLVRSSLRPSLRRASTSCARTSCPSPRMSASRCGLVRISFRPSLNCTPPLCSCISCLSPLMSLFTSVHRFRLLSGGISALPRTAGCGRQGDQFREQRTRCCPLQALHKTAFQASSMERSQSSLPGRETLGRCFVLGAVLKAVQDGATVIITMSFSFSYTACSRTPPAFSPSPCCPFRHKLLEDASGRVQRSSTWSILTVELYEKDMLVDDPSS